MYSSYIFSDDVNHPDDTDDEDGKCDSLVSPQHETPRFTFDISGNTTLLTCAIKY